MLSSESQIDV